MLPWPAHIALRLKLTSGHLPLIALLLSIAGLAACGGTTLALGDTPGEAQHRAGELLGALALRFGPTAHDARFAALRSGLAQAAFIPSRVYDDQAAWTHVDGIARGVGFSGAAREGRYELSVEPEPPRPASPGEYRGLLELRRLQEGEFEWRMSEELAVGPVSGDDLDRALTLLLVLAEGLVDADPQTLVRRELPRTARALGRLASLDSLRLSREAGDITAVDFEASLALDQESATAFPSYARFLRKHALPLRMRAVAHDLQGAEWWQVSLEDGHLRARLRVQGGFLAPLQGRPRRLPRRLRVTLDLTTEVGPFRVGFGELSAYVELAHTPGRRTFAASFNDEPRWSLPFLVKPLLRSPLRRPFEGEGARFEGGILDGGSQTLLVREYRMAVKESWVVRWLGGLMGTAVSDFRRGAEQQADRFTAECLQALRADLLDLAENAQP